MDRCSQSTSALRKWWCWRDTRQSERPWLTMQRSLEKETSVHCFLTSTKATVSLNSHLSCLIISCLFKWRRPIVCFPRHFIQQWWLLERDETFCPIYTEGLWDGQKDEWNQNNWGMPLPDWGIWETQRWLSWCVSLSRESLNFSELTPFACFSSQVNPSGTPMRFHMLLQT